MKLNKFFFGLFVCASFCACSNDESELITGDVPKVFTGDEAYINVRLSDASSLTRATTTDPGYEYGTPDEHAVSNAFFYFYDANGLFVSEGSAWNGGTGKGSLDGPIEFKSNNVIVLKGLKGKTFPKYMVTVLNRPTGFSVSPTSTLDEMKAKLASETSVGIREGSKFVMSTTSFVHENGALDGKYFVTEVDEANFSLQDPNVSTTDYVPVNVFVERLAAKVSLNVSSDLTPAEINGEKYYEVKATVAGDGNDDDVASGSDNQVAAEDLYVKLLGWKLNATAKRSYIVKNIDESWTNYKSEAEPGPFGFVWNKPTDFRSFWGMSFNYGMSGYPENAAGASTSEYLDYVNLNNPNSLGTSDYCAENTNTSAIVTANYPSAVTSVLLSAQVCDEKGQPLDLVRFNGVLFTNHHFTEYILNVMNGKTKWNLWKETTPEGATEKTYAQLDENDVKLVNVGDGEVKLVLDFAENVYSKDGTDEKPIYNKIEDFTIANKDLADETTGAIGYKGGLMYYNIPIEHLNNGDVTMENGVETIPEAKYGVVRNHHYYITVNKLENIGKGIFDPDEEIVPGKGDDGKNYYVGADINILSWKIVGQDVDL